MSFKDPKEVNLKLKKKSIGTSLANGHCNVKLLIGIYIYKELI